MTTTHAATESPSQHPLAADPCLITSRIQELAALSEPGEGVTRLAYTELERRAHRLFAQWMREYDCAVDVDAAGNTIATRPGEAADAAALGTGSHLDSVYHGGRYDGIVGVIAATECARMLHETEVRTRHPLRFVAFAGEEGARFGQACLGSKLAAGLSSAAELAERVDVEGVSLAEAMRAVDLDPDGAAETPWNPREWAGFLELHIEQGSVLEREGLDLGIVDLISGSTRLELVLTGTPSHTGGTPMAGRADALAAASEAVLLAEQVAIDPQHQGTRATVGALTVSPGSITTIPGTVRMSLDVRDIDADRQRQAACEIVRRVQAVCARRRVGLDVRLLGDTSPVILPAWLREIVTDTARTLGVPYRVLTSGASHDSQMINTITPTGMLFVPSIGGLSHVPAEHTTPEQIALGARVLTASLLALDDRVGTVTGKKS